MREEWETERGGGGEIQRVNLLDSIGKGSKDREDRPLFFLIYFFPFLPRIIYYAPSHGSSASPRPVDIRCSSSP